MSQGINSLAGDDTDAKSQLKLDLHLAENKIRARKQSKY